MTFYIKVVREQGSNPITNQLMPYAEEILTIEAENIDRAVKQSYIKSTIKFMGQQRRTYVLQDGAYIEYFGNF